LLLQIGQLLAAGRALRPPEGSHGPSRAECHAGVARSASVARQAAAGRPPFAAGAAQQQRTGRVQAVAQAWALSRAQAPVRRQRAGRAQAVAQVRARRRAGAGARRRCSAAPARAPQRWPGACASSPAARASRARAGGLRRAGWHGFRVARLPLD
jgi:hypothetical protein